MIDTSNYILLLYKPINSKYSIQQNVQIFYANGKMFKSSFKWTKFSNIHSNEQNVQIFIQMNKMFKYSFKWTKCSNIHSNEQNVQGG